MSTTHESENQQEYAARRQKLLELKGRIDALLQSHGTEGSDRSNTDREIDHIAEEIESLSVKAESRDQLQEKEDFFEMMTNLRQGIIGVVNENYVTEFIRGKGLEPLDLTSEDLVGKVLPDVNPSEEDRATLIAAFDNTLQGKRQEFIVQYKDHYYQMHTMPVQDPETLKKKIMFICWDITTEKVGDIKLQTALDASGVIIAEYDFFQEQFRPNRALNNLVGLPEGQPMSLNDFINFYHPEDRERRLEQIADGHDLGAMDYDARIFTPEGMKWIRIVGNVLPNNEEKPSLGVAAIVDITKDKELIEQARLSEERFRLIADSAPVMIWMSNADKASIYLNPKWLEFTGREQYEDLGDGWLDHLHPEDRNNFLRNRDLAFETKKNFVAELRFRRKDGEYRWLLNSGSPIFDNEGIFRGFIGTCVDVTEQKENTRELEKRVAERTQELANLNTQLEEYAHAASHDLQEPLRKIEMFFSIARDPSTSPERSEKYLDKIEGTARRMRELVKDILSFGSLGNATPKFTEVDLDLLIEELTQDFELLISESDTKVQKSKLGVVQGDRIKLHQLFSNLLKNAITYNADKPKIEINIRDHVDVDEYTTGTSDLPGRSYKCITVKDNGIGFRQDLAETIVKPFQRLNSKDLYPGTGLGLSIVNRIVDLHKGQLDIRSEPGKGSEFRVYLPVVQETQPELKTLGE